jgi:hypothetical protein
MAFTRFHDDDARIAIQLQQQTDQERWYLDVPGNGEKPCFMLDPYIIPQKWGGNLWTHSVDINSSFLGIDRQLNRDCLDKEKYKRQIVHAAPIDTPVCDKFLTTEQSRAVLPAWMFRDLPQNHAYYLPNNPQAHTEMQFQNNISTRILEKDTFKQQNLCTMNNDQGYTVPVVEQKGRYIGGPITCVDDCKRV